MAGEDDDDSDDCEISSSWTHKARSLARGYGRGAWAPDGVKFWAREFELNPSCCGPGLCEGAGGASQGLAARQ